MDVNEIIYEMSKNGDPLPKISAKTGLETTQVRHRQSLMAVDRRSLAFEVVVKNFGSRDNFKDLEAGYINKDYMCGKKFGNVVKVIVFEDPYECRQRYFKNKSVGQCAPVSYGELNDILNSDFLNGCEYRVSLKPSYKAFCM